MENNFIQKQDNPLVFIRCLTFNHESYIEDALNGFVMQQTNFPFVVTIVNDASPDNTKNVIERFITKTCDSANILYEQTSYANVIKAIPKSNAKCLLFVLNLFENHFQKKSHRPYYQEYVDEAKYWAECEGDDYWIDPLKLQRQVDFMETNLEYGLCYTDYNICNQFGDLTEVSHFIGGGAKPILTFEEHLFRKGYIAPMTWLYRNDLYDAIKENIPKEITDYSYVLALEFFLHSKVGFLPITTATYRIHQGSICRPLSMEALFQYRKSVCRTQAIYAHKYCDKPEILYLLKRIEVEDLLPMAIEINDIDYIKECKAFSIEYEYPIQHIFERFRKEKKIKQIRKTYLYRIGKLIIKCFKRSQ